jgi:hypothetical protein
MKYIQLKDAVVRLENVAAVGQATVPPTYQTPPYYVVSIWLDVLKEPLNISYAEVEERNAAYADIIEQILK